MKPLVLVVIDGFGYRPQHSGNAVALAQKPNLDYFEKNFPFTFLQASGELVGLEWGEAGNSEVGHLSLGAGRVIKHYLRIINEAIREESFFRRPALLETFISLRQNRSRWHLIGLLTSGTVHASFKHLTALLDLIKKQGSRPEVYLHLFADGKDSGLHDALPLWEKLNEHLKDLPSVKMATLMGRNWAMERNNDWQKTKIAYELITAGRGQSAENWPTKIKEYYNQGLTDDSLPPTAASGLSAPLVRENDALLFFNFREDSLRQLVTAFSQKEFGLFARAYFPSTLLATMVSVLEDSLIKTVFDPVKVKNNLAQWLSLNGKKQLHIAESEKYAHVTSFFNGLEKKTYPEETDFLLPSLPDPASAPAMQSQAIAEKAIIELRRQFYDFLLINFANADILSHLGNINLAARGIEKVDEALGSIYQEIKKQAGVLIITSDHGNAEELIYAASGERETKHNLNPVPFYLVDERWQGRQFPPEEIIGILPDVAPTILDLMGLPRPLEMTGNTLLKHL